MIAIRASGFFDSNCTERAVILGGKAIYLSILWLAH
jgi:hypothetical protein